MKTELNVISSINEIKKCKSIINEYCLASTKGLKFIVYEDLRLKIKIENYLSQKNVLSFVEYTDNKYIVGEEENANLYIISRLKGNIVQEIVNITGNIFPLQFILIFGYDYDRFPYILFRDN